ncbi:short-chain dehydrogenase/reductase [Nocardia yamanashiensis]|uniref:short-chain dehydrogenase/reductase n=1 Tax=Nocardia yamanashiensis TaxID=209247 RepID=UPI00082DBD6C|nr:short-chain dehydrogenase/reductase [Nocardia yamanashiensis]
MGRLELNGKVALVTGGTRGIGLATARALRERGARVAIIGRDGENAAKVAASLGDGVLGLGADVGDRAAVELAVAATVERFGRLDVAVANAGVTARLATVRAMPPEEFEKVVRVNLLGAYYTAHAALPHILETRGHISLVSSIYAFTQGAFVAPYAASKAAVEQFGRALRVELAPHRASVTVAYFGFVDTDMVRFEVDTDPLGVRGTGLVPWPLNQHLTPEQGAEALIRGIEQRSAQIIAPSQWSVLSVLRGIVNPGVDFVMSKLPLISELVTQGDSQGVADPAPVDPPERPADRKEAALRGGRVE